MRLVRSRVADLSKGDVPAEEGVIHVNLLDIECQLVTAVERRTRYVRDADAKNTVRPSEHPPRLDSGYNLRFSRRFLADVDVSGC